MDRDSQFEKFKRYDQIQGGPLGLTAKIRDQIILWRRRRKRRRRRRRDHIVFTWCILAVVGIWNHLFLVLFFYLYLYLFQTFPFIFFNGSFPFGEVLKRSEQKLFERREWVFPMDNTPEHHSELYFSWSRPPACTLFIQTRRKVGPHRKGHT